MTWNKTNLSREILFNRPSRKELHYLKQLFAKPFYRYATSLPVTQDILAHIEGPSKSLPINNREFRYIIQSPEHELIGYIKGYYPVDDNSLWIQVLVIDKPYLHKGYGTLIVKRLISRLSRNFKLQAVYLTCHNYNIVGKAFWKSLGFSPIRSIKTTHHLYKVDIRSLTCTQNHSQH